MMPRGVGGETVGKYRGGRQIVVVLAVVAAALVWWPTTGRLDQPLVCWAEGELLICATKKGDVVLYSVYPSEGGEPLSLPPLFADGSKIAYWSKFDSAVVTVNCRGERTVQRYEVPERVRNWSCSLHIVDGSWALDYFPSTESASDTHVLGAVGTREDGHSYGWILPPAKGSAWRIREEQINCWIEEIGPDNKRVISIRRPAHTRPYKVVGFVDPTCAHRIVQGMGLGSVVDLEVHNKRPGQVDIRASYGGGTERRYVGPVPGGSRRTFSCVGVEHRPPTIFVDDSVAGPLSYTRSGALLVAKLVVR